MSKLYRTGLNVNADLARMMLEYDAETGVLTWRGSTLQYLDSEKACKFWDENLAGKPAFTRVSRNGYLVGSLAGRHHLAHRMIWLIVAGRWPTMIDHINGDRSDNRASNLREVDALANSQNMGLRYDNKSGHSGVFWLAEKRLWRVSLRRNKRTYYVGKFKRLADAVGARDEAAIKLGFHENHGRRAGVREPAAEAEARRIGGRDVAIETRRVR